MILDAMTYSIIAVVAIMSVVVIGLSLPAECSQEDDNN